MTVSITPHEAECSSLRRWLFDAAVPFWAEQGIDGRGLAYEEFGFDGRPKEVGYRRSLVQFRQVYVFARSALMGVVSPALSSELFHRVAALAWHPRGGFVHTLDSNGAMLNPVRDCYDQAFGLLACAWAYGVDHEAATLDYAYRTLDFLGTDMASATGGCLEKVSEDVATPQLPRRQNPHMHLLEAYLSLYEVSGDVVFRDHAARVVDLFDSRFVASTGALREFFDNDWRPAAGSAGQSVEPGHHYEWVWLLHEYARLTGGPVHPCATELFDFAGRHGLDHRGRPVAEIDTQGEQRRRSVKLWAVGEQLKAHVVRAEANATTFDPAVVSIVDSMTCDFLLDAPPLWFEELAADGTPERKRMPASTLYHVTSAAAELLRWQTGVKSPFTQWVSA